MKDLTFYEKSMRLEKFPIKIRISPPCKQYPAHFPLHWHEHIELLYFLEGTCKITNGGETVTAEKNDLIIINCNELHSTEMSDDCILFLMQISPTFFSDVEFDNILFETHIKNDKEIRKYFSEIAFEKESMKKNSDMQIKGLVYLLMAYLSRNYKLEESDILIKKKKLIKINSILQYLSANYHNKLTSKSIAKKFFLSEYYFCHFFKSETGMSPINYINKLRVENAALLFNSSDKNITEIALKVGFDDSNYFTKVFKKYMGVTPREYKKSINNQLNG